MINSLKLKKIIEKKKLYIKYRAFELKFILLLFNFIKLKHKSIVFTLKD